MVKTYSIRFPIIFILVSICVFLFGASDASAELTKQEIQRIAPKLSAAINRVIEKHQGGIELREKAIRRLSECSTITGIMSKQKGDAETNARLWSFANLYLEVSVLLASEISLDRYKQIVDVAHDTVMKMPERNDKKELFLLLKNCKSFTDPEEIENALMELTL